MPRFPNWSRLIHKSEDRGLVPSSQGVYKLYWSTESYDTLQYVGETINLKNRLYAHNQWTFWNYYSYSETIGYRESGRKDIEYRLIRRHQPPYNDQHRD